jgi:branched-chain amino acid aminotransferase
MNAERLVYQNGQFVPESEARISVFDRGFLYGDGIFETMRAYSGNIFRLDQHIRRLKQSAELIGLTVGLEPEKISGICHQLLKKNDLADAILRISVTRGPSAGGIGIRGTSRPSIIAFVRPPMPLPAGAYNDGVSARIVSIRRSSSLAIDTRIKSMNYLNLILARAEAEEAGAYEAILLNHAGYIAETSTANIFFATAGEVFTPGLDCDILAGITREAVIELASGMNIPLREKRIEPSEIVDFEECFLTNSGVEILPVTRIDDNEVGNGNPGLIYNRLRQAYQELVRKR